MLIGRCPPAEGHTVARVRLLSEFVIPSESEDSACGAPRLPLIVDFRGCGNLVEILWDVRVDDEFRCTVCLKGFEDGRVRSCSRSGWTEDAPLRRNADSVFDNQVERASRERTESGVSPNDLTR